MAGFHRLEVVVRDAGWMALSYLPVDRDQQFLMPPDMREWLPAGHLVWFVLEVVGRLDTAALHARHPNDGVGRRAYDGSTRLSGEPGGSAAKRAGPGGTKLRPAQARDQGKYRNEGGQARHPTCADPLLVAASPHSNAKSP